MSENKNHKADQDPGEQLKTLFVELLHKCSKPDLKPEDKLILCLEYMWWKNILDSKSEDAE
ncbi:MAG: hypothetical protein ABIM30_01345 [candidate division WOR-3 bacterium]